MKVTIVTDSGEFFVIKMNNPSKEELKTISGPDIDEQMNPTEVWIDRKLNFLKKTLLNNTYKCKY